MEYLVCIMQEINWDVFFGGVSAIGSILACWIGWKISKDISFKKDVKQKQLETIFQLVNDLQTLNIYFLYRNDGKSSGDVYFPFFEMTHDKFLSQEFIPLDRYTIFVSKSFLYENPIFRYVDNPFLPKSIADNLIKLYPRGGDEVVLESPSNLQIFISDSRPYIGKSFKKEISHCYSSLELVFDATHTLKGSILKWLSDNEANELNLREKLINIDN